jgi:hypothetical protein
MNTLCSKLKVLFSLDQILENAREIFADRLRNAEAKILTDSREQRKKYSSKSFNNLDCSEFQSDIAISTPLS